MAPLKITTPISRPFEKNGTGSLNNMTPPNALCVDTDIIIDHLRGNKEAIHFLENTNKILMVSVITVTEIFSGIKNIKENKMAEMALGLFECLGIDNKIALIAGDFRKQYTKSHNIGLADALIAATAHYHNAIVVTRNIKHFPMIQTLKPY